MQRQRYTWLNRLLLAAVGFAWVMAVHVSAAPDAGKAQARPAAPLPPAQYVGSDTCVACHDGQDATLAKTPHGKAANPRSPAAAQGCESCHGPGSRHVEDPADDTAIRKFAKMSPRAANDTCLSCHTKSPHTLWQGSAHDTRNLSCITCHSVHDPKSPTAQLTKATQTELCATCHRVQATKMKRVSHMPLPEGKMECSSCHNPHGATNVRLLKVGNWVNESCVSCHTEKRGPFLFEHAAGRESCITCHDPHGSSNDRLLVAKLPMLCQRCHIGTRHPSTIYDSTAFESKSVRVIGRACVNCHAQIHGSNHPAGQAFTR
ncbi:MAG: DmsE family decaheme c-type cytochrome [Vicinamibacterales bacterium]